MTGRPRPPRLPWPHLAVRLLAMALVAAGAVQSLSAPANPQHVAQARAWLEGTVWIEHPEVTHDLARVDGRWTSPFPPLPAALAVISLAAGRRADLMLNLMIVLAGAFALWLAGRLGDRLGGVRSGTWAVVALGPGSGLAMATALHDTYHGAHVLAVLATTAALWLALVRRRALPAGLALGIAALARQATVLGAPALAALAGRRRPRRIAAVLAGVALPLLVYLALNLARFGSPFATGYDTVEHLPFLKADIASHGAFSLHWVPRNLRVLFAGLPAVVPVAPWVVPDVRGMALWLVSPWVLAGLLPLVRPDRPGARRTAAWCWAAAALISVPHLLYVNTGYAQVGYRFALDELPFLLVAAVLGVRRMRPAAAVALVGLASAVSLWAWLAVQSFARWAPYLPAPG